MKLFAFPFARRVSRMDKGEWIDMRAGERLAIFDLRAFGPNRGAWAKGLKRATATGAIVVAVSRKDGSTICECRDASGAELFALTLAKDNGEKRMAGKDPAEMARDRWSDRRANRLPREAAELVWFDPMISEATALRRIGCSRAWAMKEFGGRRRGPYAEKMAAMIEAKKQADRSKRKRKK